MKKISFLFAMACIAFSTVSAQFELGGEYQHNFGKSIPANTVGLGYEGYSLTNKSSFLVGLNYTFPSSSGESTKTGGWGVHAGFRYNFNFNASGNLYSGARVDLRFNKDDKGTKSSIVMPSLEGGYHYTFNNFGPGAFASPGIALGYPVRLNTGKETEGADEGLVFSTRINVGIRF